jgi:hypothetical protein
MAISSSRSLANNGNNHPLSRLVTIP